MQYLVSGLEMRELDRQTIEDHGVPGRVLMEVAGRAVADVCHKMLSGPSQVVIACGRGNNGGDGFVTARALAARGHTVRVFIFGEATRISGDASAALKTLERSGAATIAEVQEARALLAFSSALASSRLVVDAVLGTGLSSDVRGVLGDAIQVINGAAAPCVSVDIASGIDSDTGAVLGCAVQAEQTVTFGFAKRGHYLFPGAGFRGQLTVADIGIPTMLAEQLGVVGRVVHAADGPSMIRRRERDAHKGSFGHVVVLAGSEHTPGAAVLALRGALRSGVGLVSWATDKAALAHSAPPPEAMLRVRDEGEGPDAWAKRVLEGATAVVVGPGLSAKPERERDLAALLSSSHVPICIDADGINLLAQNPSLWPRKGPPLVLTPHPREMARVRGGDVVEIQRDRVAAALQLAVARACVVVLKGAGTVVAEPGGTATVVAAGSPALAAGGTGDVLAGVIGGLLAQRLDVITAAQLGTLAHACAGERAAEVCGEAGTTAGDVAEALGVVFTEWGR